MKIEDAMIKLFSGIHDNFSEDAMINDHDHDVVIVNLTMCRSKAFLRAGISPSIASLPTLLAHFTMIPNL